MATRTLLGKKVSPKFVLSSSPDGTIPTSELLRMGDQLSSVIGLLSSGLSIGSGNSSFVAGNLRGQFITHVFPGAGVASPIEHQVGAVPVAAFVCISDRSCNIYDPNFRAGWGMSRVYLTADVDEPKVSLLLLA